MKKIAVGKMILFPYFCSIIFLFFSACIIPDDEPAFFENKFSVRNNTNSAISVKLVTGIIPHAAARYDELTPIPDEAYKLSNKLWSPEESCTVKPKSHNWVANNTPIGELGRKYENYEYSESLERHYKLREMMLDKLVSFTVTISSGDAIIYRIAGWDIPDADMEKYHVNDKLWGYYDTKEENYFYVKETGYASHYPLLYSKLLTGHVESSGISVSSLTYYIDVKPGTVSLVKFDPYSYGVKDNNFWRNH
jgi:hypothetical protein